MAAIDSLIRLLDRQQGDALILAKGKPPVLMKAGGKIPLSMPPLDATMMDTFLSEVATVADLEALRTRGLATTSYPVDQPAFSVQIKNAGGELSLTLQRGATPGRPVSPALPPLPLAPSLAAMPHPSPPVAQAFTPPPVRHKQKPQIALGEPLDLRGLLDRAFHDEAVSDLLLSAGHASRIRTGGDLVDLHSQPLDDAEILALLDPQMTDPHRQTLAQSGSVDFAVEVDGRRFRVNLFKQHGGLAAAIRSTARRAPTLDELRLPDALRALTTYPNGLILVTGPTGSGKSTTLVALIDHLTGQSGRALHVITLEDPIEFRYQVERSLVHQREVGTHVESFEIGLRAALRENPDVIMVGEMRDRATIAAALTAASTGHLVLSSLHAGSAAMAIDRIIDVFPEHQQPQIRQQVAQSLRAVVTQVLVPSRTPPLRLRGDRAGARHPGDREPDPRIEGASDREPDSHQPRRGDDPARPFAGDARQIRPGHPRGRLGVCRGPAALAGSDSLALLLLAGERAAQILGRAVAQGDRGGPDPAGQALGDQIVVGVDDGGHALQAKIEAQGVEPGEGREQLGVERRDAGGARGRQAIDGEAGGRAGDLAHRGAAGQLPRDRGRGDHVAEAFDGGVDAGRHEDDGVEGVVEQVAEVQGEGVVAEGQRRPGQGHRRGRGDHGAR